MLFHQKFLCYQSIWGKKGSVISPCPSSNKGFRTLQFANLQVAGSPWARYRRSCTTRFSRKAPPRFLSRAWGEQTHSYIKKQTASSAPVYGFAQFWGTRTSSFKRGFLSFLSLPPVSQLASVTAGAISVRRDSALQVRGGSSWEKSALGLSMLRPKHVSDPSTCPTQTSAPVLGLTRAPKPSPRRRAKKSLVINRSSCYTL